MAWECMNRFMLFPKLGVRIASKVRLCMAIETYSKPWVEVRWILGNMPRRDMDHSSRLMLLIWMGHAKLTRQTANLTFKTADLQY